MANNRAALDAGFKKAEDLIRGHLLEVLRNTADDIQQSAFTYAAAHPGHMTGNTVTSISAGVFDKGKYAHGAHYITKDPMRNKLTKGEVFPAGSMRWDGGIQGSNFRASVSTDQSYGMSSAEDFLKSKSAGTYADCFKITVCTGSEYTENVIPVVDAMNLAYSDVAMFLKRNLTRLG